MIQITTLETMMPLGNRRAHACRRLFGVVGLSVVVIGLMVLFMPRYPKNLSALVAEYGNPDFVCDRAWIDSSLPGSRSLLRSPVLNLVNPDRWVGDDKCGACVLVYCSSHMARGYVESVIDGHSDASQGIVFAMGRSVEVTVVSVSIEGDITGMEKRSVAWVSVISGGTSK